MPPFLAWVSAGVGSGDEVAADGGVADRRRGVRSVGDPDAAGVCFVLDVGYRWTLGTSVSAIELLRSMLLASVISDSLSVVAPPFEKWPFGALTADRFLHTALWRSTTVPTGAIQMPPAVGVARGRAIALRRAGDVVRDRRVLGDEPAGWLQPCRVNALRIDVAVALSLASTTASQGGVVGQAHAWVSRDESSQGSVGVNSAHRW